ncbi:alpha/beta hydrolase [Planotetraspora thailandica]|uniref:Alpha/beta hydrolase n=1 Tax=Planotetraspora thailandica TaxID=487172 RepID=A0A8J3XYV7_9ACTN|nr:alpha/beta hydrolase [Planotetraspora thailandica]GII57846.1 alpha/beta hydrolase [Planotetraspora thailandica]
MFVNRIARGLGRHRLRYAVAATAAAAAVAIPLGLTPATAATAYTPATHTAPTHVKPTIVLVHGAWADASSWSGEVTRLQADGYTVAVAPNPLRGLSDDTDYLRDYLASITGPIVLVGHSYGGAVITNAATGNPNVKALVYVDAYIPDEGDTVADLSGPDSALAPGASNPASVFKLVDYPNAPDNIYDTYVLPDVFVRAFAGDLSPAKGAQLAASQSPTSLLALGLHSGPPAWKTIPAWDLIGTNDKIIPVAQQIEMAKNAGAHTQKFTASHLGIISQPATVTKFIEQAACSVR